MWQLGLAEVKKVVSVNALGVIIVIVRCNLGLGCGWTVLDCSQSLDCICSYA